MIRELVETDIKGCISVVNSVWKFKEIFSPNCLSVLFLDIYTLGSLSGSNFAMVAEENNEIVGFLFGKTKNGKIYKTKYSGIIGQFNLLFSLLILRKVSMKKKTEYIRMINEHEINRLKAEPRREFEVNLFAVKPNMQGKRIGKDLMQKYINKCMKDGVKRITLDTDEECNYKFYEHFGYVKIAEFDSPIQYLYTQKSGLSFVYELKIV